MRRREVASAQLSAARVRLDKPRVLAQVALLAEQYGTRLLAGGGPLFTSSGLISPRISKAAVVVVDPVSVARFVHILLSNGWQRMPQRGSLLPAVSSRFTHPQWACELEVYFLLPGFYSPPALVFDSLWRRRRQVVLHGVSVPTLDRIAIALVAAHEQFKRDPEPGADLDFLVEQFFTRMTDDERADLVRLVARLGAKGEMRFLLEKMGVEVGPIALPSQSYAQWRLALTKVGGTMILLLGFLECPPGRRAETVREAASRWPNRMVLAYCALPWNLVVVALVRHRQQQFLRRMTAVWRAEELA